MTDDAEVKADIYYTLACLAANQRNYAKAREYSNRVLEENPNDGRAYVIIGQSIAATASNYFPNDPVKRKCVYYLAVDKLERARQLDPSCAGDVNSLIATYRSYFPTNEEIFMQPDLEKGKTITIGGESTKIR